MEDKNNSNYNKTAKKFKATNEILNSDFKTYNSTLNYLKLLKTFCILFTFAISCYYIYKIIDLVNTDYTFDTGISKLDKSQKSFMNNFVSTLCVGYILNIISSVISCLVFCIICNCIKSNSEHLLYIDDAIFEDNFSNTEDIQDNNLSDDELKRTIEKDIAEK